MKKIKSRKIKIKNKKIFKLMILIFFIVVSLRYVLKVDAGMNDTTIERNRVNDVYAVTTLNGVQRIFYLNMYRMNGRVAYCIELGVDITTNIYHSSDNFSISYLSSDQIEYIRSISYFGYQYAGHDDYRYYMAAQELIWEYLSSVDVEWTNVLNANGERIDISFYKKEILEKRNRYYGRVTFSWIDGQKYFGGDKIILSDIAGVLSDYEVVSNNYSNVNIDGNILNITVSNNYIGTEEIILKKKNFYNYDSKFYYYDTSQKLISNGNFKDITRTLYFNIVGRKMKVQVVDKTTKNNIPLGQASLAGAEYELYNDKNERLGIYTTNSDGSFEVDNLFYGKYYFKQIKASKGYLLSEEEKIIDFVDASEKVVLEQEVISTLVEIRKKYGVSDNYIPEAGISFHILDWNNLIYDEIITDKDGIAAILLPYGNYTIVQDNTSWGYSKVEPFQVVVDEDVDYKKVYNLINELIQYKVKINTIEVNSGRHIVGNNIVYRIREKGSEKYIEFNGKSEFEADSNGTLVFPLLFSYGDYVLEQVNVPYGVLLNTKQFEFSINEETQFCEDGDDLYLNLDFYNKFIIGNLEVIVNKEQFYSSINNYTYEKVPVIKKEFLLIANGDIVFNEEVIYQDKEEISRLITNEDGVFVINNLYLGNYCLIDADKNRRECFSIKSDSNKKEFVEKRLEISETLDKNDILIRNEDESGRVMEGNVFEIYNENGNVIYTGITNDKGIIKINDLVVGNYCIKQKKITDNKYLLADDLCIYLDSNKEVKIINNIIKRNKILVPDTFSNKFNFFGLLLINVFFLVVIIFYVYKKIFVCS